MECVLWIAGGLFTAALTYVGFCAAIMAVLHSPAWSVRGSADQDFYDLLCAPARGLKLIKRKWKPMKQVTIYTDGACSGNPGPGGWGAILLYGAHKKELSGGAPDTTNNRMELTAVIEALSMLKEPCVVELWSDSKYVIDGLSKGWAKGWRARGWVKSDKKPALNPDLWERLLELEECHTLRYHWVKGHAENPYNNRCDELAVAESRKYK